MMILGQAIGIWIAILFIEIYIFINKPKYRKMTKEEKINLLKALTRKSFLASALSEHYNQPSDGKELE